MNAEEEKSFIVTQYACRYVSTCWTITKRYFSPTDFQCEICTLELQSYTIEERQRHYDGHFQSESVEEGELCAQTDMLCSSFTPSRRAVQTRSFLTSCIHVQRQSEGSQSRQILVCEANWDLAASKLLSRAHIGFEASPPQISTARADDSSCFMPSLSCTYL